VVENGGKAEGNNDYGERCLLTNLGYVF